MIVAALMKCLAITLVFSVLVGCAHLTPREQVESAEDQWKGTGIQDYDFTLDIYSQVGGAPCAPGRGPIDVQVRDGQTVKFGTCGSEVGLVQEFGTVPRMFETIRANLNERPPRYRVRFNTSLGYPEFIDAVYHRFATDSTAQYTVKDFREIR
jgi:hypothetical protein